MPKTVRNPRTGRLRRQTTHYTNRNHRSKALTPNDVQSAIKVQQAIQQNRHRIVSVVSSASAAVVASMLAVMGGLDPSQFLLWAALLGVATQIAITQQQLYYRIDSMISDMTPEEEAEPVARLAPSFRRIDHFATEDQARCNTNFTKSQLQDLIVKFAMPEMVRVGYGQGTSRRHYNFHREELLIYMLMKFKTDKDHTDMADTTTGGDS